MGLAVFEEEKHHICRVRGVKTIVGFFRGICILFCKIRGGQYFAAEGREIEGPPLWICFWQLPLATANSLLQAVYVYKKV